LVDGLVLMNTAFGTKEISVKREKQNQVPDAMAALDEIPEEVKNPLATYDEVKLRKAMHAYKVKREHVLIMIDYCQSEQVSQCPAYAWKDYNYVYFLLLEQEPRMIKAELSKIDGVHIRRGMTARPTSEYVNMKEKSLVSKLFAEYLPNYYQTSDGYRVEFKKNMYSVAPGIWCTSTSVKNICKLIPGRFYLDGSAIAEENEYYQDIYIARVLFWDGIYTPADYKEKVIAGLTRLAEANISMDVFHEYLAKMLLKGLIPQEYADYAMNKRAVK